MKSKAKKPFLNMDERNKLIAYKVSTIMYLLTIVAMQGIVLYRQFVLGQELGDFEDLAVIMTINSLFLLSALLYFGAIPIRRLSVKRILQIYLVFLALGSLFTVAKYTVFQTPGLTFGQLLDKLLIVGAVISLIMGFFVLFTILGKRRQEKELE